jgi:cellulose synthase/poly-beta-1,6-N-acetylglucosamine synthase-like glycosyltransferase
VIRIWLTRVHGATRCGPSVDLALPEISQKERRLALNPYAIIASVHNEADDIDRFLTAVQPFKDVVWLIDDASGDSTAMRLRQEGWHCLAGTVNRNKPGAIYHLLRTLPPEIETVVIMDPDVRWRAAPGTERAVLEEVIVDLQRSGAAALTPRIQARRRGWLVECQALEYELCCGLGRKSLGDLCCNSGVSVYRRRALEAAMARHSLSIYAEDLENSLILLAAGKRIYYDDRLVVETEAKRTWRGLFSQRVGWSFGCAKLFLERIPLLLAVARRSPLGAYQYLIYLGLNGILLLPLKLFTIGILMMSLLRAVDDLLMANLVPQYAWNDPFLFVLWYAKSTTVLLIACLAAVPSGERARYLVTIPLYGLYTLLQYLPMTVGYLNLLSVKLLGRRLYADHYERNPRLSTSPVNTMAEII